MCLPPDSAAGFFSAAVSTLSHVSCSGFRVLFVQGFRCRRLCIGVTLVHARHSRRTIHCRGDNFFCFSCVLFAFDSWHVVFVEVFELHFGSHVLLAATSRNRQTLGKQEDKGALELFFFHPAAFFSFVFVPVGGERVCEGCRRFQSTAGDTALDRAHNAAAVLSPLVDVVQCRVTLFAGAV